MKELYGKVAVITGAASGIGLAIAHSCAKAGMKLVLADIEEAALQKAKADLAAQGAKVVAAVTDVSREDEVNRLAALTIEHFGEVHVLFNNAGVGAGSLLWSSTVLDWKWTLGVNLWGAIYAVNAFVPIMLKQNCECHIVNTASRAGLESGPFNGIYRVSKHALVGYSETLYHELGMVQSRIGVSVICPGNVRTQICDAARNRPEELQNPSVDVVWNEQGKVVDEMIRAGVQNGMSPAAVAEMTLEAIRDNRFYILPDQECKTAVRQRMEDILNERNPRFIVPS